MIPPLVGMDELRLAGGLEFEVLTWCTTSPLETSTGAAPA